MWIVLSEIWHIDWTFQFRSIIFYSEFSKVIGIYNRLCSGPVCVCVSIWAQVNALCRFLCKAHIECKLTDHWYNNLFFSFFLLFFSIAAHLNGPIFQSMVESSIIFAVYCLWRLSTLCNGPSSIPIYWKTFPRSNHPGYINGTQWTERYTMDQWTATPLCRQMDIQEAVRQLENHWKLSENESWTSNVPLTAAS